MSKQSTRQLCVHTVGDQTSVRNMRNAFNVMRHRRVKQKTKKAQLNLQMMAFPHFLHVPLFQEKKDNSRKIWMLI